MGEFRDLTGQTFGQLTVLKRVYIDGKRNTYWECKCTCGNITIKSREQLLSGNKDKKSCGCTGQTGGHSRHRLYKIWYGMNKRCYNENDKNYYLYGERGIKVCKEWRDNYLTFYNWAINREDYQDTFSIDRIDNNGDYEPNNCRWVSTSMQACNRRTSHFIYYNGKKYSVYELAKELDINPERFYYQVIIRGNNIDDVIKMNLPKYNTYVKRKDKGKR